MQLPFWANGLAKKISNTSPLRLIQAVASSRGFFAHTSIPVNDRCCRCFKIFCIASSSFAVGLSAALSAKWLAANSFVSIWIALIGTVPVLLFGFATGRDEG